ncbi:MAG: c-type cytochrome [Bauldia sp.]|nr:c-type cytochrome [Bauldia sp.]
MRCPGLAVAPAFCLLAFASGPALSQDANLGKVEFEANCAACHGPSGKGDGPFAEYITTPVADLTLLANKNNGQFPADRVREFVDGRAEVAQHGTRDMPIWGAEYNAQAVEYFREVWKIEDPVSFVKDRIDALVAYVETLQEP